MLNKIIKFALTNRLFVLGRGRPAPGGRHLHHGPHGGGRVSRPERPDRRGDDRSQRHGPRGGRAAGDLPGRDGRERRHRRAARAFLLDDRILGRLGRVRLGHGHLPRPADRLRKTGRSGGVAPGNGGQSHARTAVVDSGRSDDPRPHGRFDLDAGPAHAGRLDHSSAAAVDGRRGAGHGAGAATSRSIRSCSRPTRCATTTSGSTR